MFSLAILECSNGSKEGNFVSSSSGENRGHGKEMLKMKIEPVMYMKTIKR
jgi:hypothetical protein